MEIKNYLIYEEDKKVQVIHVEVPKSSLVKEISEPYISQIIIEWIVLFFYSEDFSLLKLVNWSRILAQPQDN